MKYLIFLSLITYAHSWCTAKTGAEWKALGCIVEHPDAQLQHEMYLGTVEPNNLLNFATCSIECVDAFTDNAAWVITQTCASGFEESDCEICPVCVESSNQPDECDANFKKVNDKCEACPENHKSIAGATECSPTTNEGVKDIFVARRQKDTDLSNDQKRLNYKALIKNLKSVIKGNNNRMAIPKGDVVINEKFWAKIQARNDIANVEVIVPKPKNTYDCSTEQDVDLSTDNIAFSIEMEPLDKAFVCNNGVQETVLSLSADGVYSSRCYIPNSGWDAWVDRELGADYECNGRTYYVGSLEGDNTGLSCAEYKEQWLQNKCCSAHNPVTCDPISQGYESAGCGTCS